MLRFSNQNEENYSEVQLICLQFLHMQESPKSFSQMPTQSLWNHCQHFQHYTYFRSGFQGAPQQHCVFQVLGGGSSYLLLSSQLERVKQQFQQDSVIQLYCSSKKIQHFPLMPATWMQYLSFEGKIQATDICFPNASIISFGKSFFLRHHSIQRNGIFSNDSSTCTMRVNLPIQGSFKLASQISKQFPTSQMTPLYLIELQSLDKMQDYMTDLSLVALSRKILSLACFQAIASLSNCHSGSTLRRSLFFLLSICILWQLINWQYKFQFIQINEQKQGFDRIEANDKIQSFKQNLEAITSMIEIKYAFCLFPNPNFLQFLPKYVVGFVFLFLFDQIVLNCAQKVLKIVLNFPRFIHKNSLPLRKSTVIPTFNFSFPTYQVCSLEYDSFHC